MKIDVRPAESPYARFEPTVPWQPSHSSMSRMRPRPCKPMRGCMLVFLAAACAATSSPTGAAAVAAPRAPSSELGAAVRAFQNYVVAASRAHYRAVLADSHASRSDRAAALRALARFGWRFDGDVAAARAELAAALENGHEVSSVWLQRGQIELEAGYPDVALTAAASALETAIGENERRLSNLLRAKARFAVDRRRVEQAAPLTPRDCGAPRQCLAMCSTGAPVTVDFRCGGC
jgi:hypothetical protein